MIDNFVEKKMNCQDGNRDNFKRHQTKHQNSPKRVDVRNGYPDFGHDNLTGSQTGFLNNLRLELYNISNYPGPRDQKSRHP